MEQGCCFLSLDSMFLNGLLFVCSTGDEQKTLFADTDSLFIAYWRIFFYSPVNEGRCETKWGKLVH